MAAYKNSDDVGYLYKLFFHDCIWEKDKIIYPASNCNAICETDIETGETIIIGKADEKEEWMLFCGVYKWKNYLILPGWRAKNALSMFNLENREWLYIYIEESKKEWLNFREKNVLEYNGYLYAFSYQLVILKINMENKSIEYIFYPNKKADEDVIGEIAVINNVVYIPVRHDNKIYKFDLCIEQWEIIEVNTKLKGIDTLCFDGQLFWMTGIGRMICAWDEKTNLSMYYRKFPQRFDRLVDRKGEEGFWFNNSIAYDNSIYFIPSDANMIIEFDTKNGEANEFFIEDEWEEKEDTRVGRYSTVKYMEAKKKENVFMMLSNKNKNLIFIDMERKTIKKIELKLSEKEGIHRLIAATPVMHEGVVNLKEWLKYVGSFEQKIKSREQEKTVGQRINTYVECSEKG